MGFFVDTVARLAITEGFKAVLAEANSRLNPDEILFILQQAEVAADTAQPELGGLFRRIDRDGANGYQKFLKFFQSGEVLTELQKPLKDRGKPDVNILVTAFRQSAAEYPDVEKYLDLMPLWMEAFVESYFSQMKGICFQVAKEQYLKQLARRVDDVKFVGIAVPGDEVEKQEVLAQIFVMPDVREEKRNFSEPKTFVSYFQSVRLMRIMDGNTGEEISITQIPEQTSNYRTQKSATRNNILEEQKEWALRDRSTPRIPAPKILNLSQKKAVVLGAPGSGKTMLVSYFALMLCETQQSDPTQIGLEKDILPVVVRIRDWILQPKMGLLEYLEYYAETNLCTKELPTGFFEHWLERGRALILLDGLDEVVDEAQRRKVAEQIETFLHRYQAELPRQRFKLYEKAVETLLTSWDSGKEIKLYETVLRFLKPDDLLYILKKLAYWIHTQGSTGETEGGTLIDKDELLRQLQREIKTLKKCEPHEAKGEAERFIDFIQRRTGLLNEQGRDRYAFVHKTFQEYLTAEEIFGIDESEEDPDIIWRHFREYLHDQHWREVLLLLVSKLKGKKAQKAIQTVLNAKSDYEQWLHRDLLFAGWCLTEDPSRLMTVAPDFVGEILDRLVGLTVDDLERVGIKVSDDATKILHYSRETTVEQVVWEKLLAQKDRIGHFRLMNFQAAFNPESSESNPLTFFQNNQDSNLRFSKASSELASQLKDDHLDAVSGLLYLLDHEDSDVRSSATSALGQLGNASSEAVSGLLFLLNVKDSSFSLSALRGELGANSDVVNGLLSLLSDKNSDVRCSAARALGFLENGSSKVIDSLLFLLSDKESYVRSSAISALGLLGNGSSEVVDGLLSLLSDKNWNVRSCLALELGLLGKTLDKIPPKVMQWMEQNPNHNGIGSAIDCLWSIVVE